MNQLNKNTPCIINEYKSDLMMKSFLKEVKYKPNVIYNSYNFILTEFL